MKILILVARTFLLTLDWFAPFRIAGTSSVQRMMTIATALKNLARECYIYGKTCVALLPLIECMDVTCYFASTAPYAWYHHFAVSPTQATTTYHIVSISLPL